MKVIAAAEENVIQYSQNFLKCFEISVFVQRIDVSGAKNIMVNNWPEEGATAEYSPHSLVLLQDCPNLNHYPNPNVRKQDLNSSPAAVW